MSFMSEFREFAVKGSVVDLAVGVIIGAAFGKIVDSLVKDLIMPVVGRSHLAETEGFEPSVREFPVRRFSKPLVSATHPRLRVRLHAGKAGYSGGFRKLQPQARHRGTTSRRIAILIAWPGSSTRIPSSGQSLSGALSAALAWVTGSATKIPPDVGE